MHPSPAVNILTRRSFTAYNLFFQEQRRRLLEDPYSVPMNEGAVKHSR